VRLRRVGTVGSALLALGFFAPSALAGSTSGGMTAGGATAPIGATGTAGATGPAGTTGATNVAAGTAVSNVTTPSVAITAPPLAPIVLSKDQSPDFVYNGPVFVQIAPGVIQPYAPRTTVASVNGGTIAGTATNSLPHLLVPGTRAEIVDGLAAAPEDAPVAVQRIIWTANAIIGRPYVYGGGHSSFKSYGYDCSGTVSFALHGDRLLKSPLDSSQFMSWGRSGQGQWVTILTNPGHAYLDVAGVRLDTSAADDPNNEQGPRWRPLRPANAGYTIRHPAGL
jgi:cell wall-associated NlpC family hydrolase